MCLLWAKPSDIATPRPITATFWVETGQPLIDVIFQSLSSLYILRSRRFLKLQAFQNDQVVKTERDDADDDRGSSADDENGDGNLRWGGLWFIHMSR